MIRREKSLLIRWVSLVGGLHHIKMIATEHHREGFGGLFFDSERTGLKTMGLAGFDGFTHVADPVGSFVAVVVTRAPIRH